MEVKLAEKKMWSKKPSSNLCCSSWARLRFSGDILQDKSKMKMLHEMKMVWTLHVWTAVHLKRCVFNFYKLSTCVELFEKIMNLIIYDSDQMEIDCVCDWFCTHVCARPHRRELCWRWSSPWCWWRRRCSCRSRLPRRWRKWALTVCLDSRSWCRSVRWRAWGGEKLRWAWRVWRCNFECGPTFPLFYFCLRCRCKSFILLASYVFFFLSFLLLLLFSRNGFSCWGLQNNAIAIVRDHCTVEPSLCSQQLTQLWGGT